jgi:hypothetical protein
VSELGLGFVATEADVLDQLWSMHLQDRWTGLKPRPPVFEIDGAREAAEIILNWREEAKHAAAPVVSGFSRPN